MNEPQVKVSVNLEPLKSLLLNFVIPLVCLLITVGLGIFYIYPTYTSLFPAKNELMEKQAKKEILENKLNVLNRIREFDSVVKENSAIVDKVLYSEPLVPKLLDQVYQMATEAGLTVTRLTYSYGGEAESTSVTNTAIPSATSASYVNVALDVQGNYSQLVLFTELIENAARFVDITNFRYSYNTAEEGPSISANFALTSPYLFVQSSAVTDEPVTLDLNDKNFTGLLQKLKSLKYYEFSNSNVVPVIEETPEPALEGVETPVSEN